MREGGREEGEGMEGGWEREGGVGGEGGGERLGRKGREVGREDGYSKNKSLLTSILFGHPLQNSVQLVNKLDRLVTRAEADITLCSYMLEAAASSAETVRIVCDDTDVFVLLRYWAWRKTTSKNIQMEKWDDTVLDMWPAARNARPVRL